MTAALNRRWFRFSLRTLFVVVTVVGVWLGWNLKEVRNRGPTLDLIVARKGSFDSVPARRQIIIYGAHWATMQSGQRLPIVWRLLGAEPINYIDIHRDQFSSEEVARIQRLFPEADIAQWYVDFGG